MTDQAKFGPPALTFDDVLLLPAHSDVLPADADTSARFWAEDVVTEPARLDADGALAVGTRPGLGVELRSDLSRLGSVERDWRAADR